MTLYLVHGNTCFECYGYEENVFGIFTTLVQAQAAKTVEHEVFASPEQLIFIIEGMRNPMNSWDKSDSERCEDKENCDGCLRKEECDNHYISKKELVFGSNDVNLMMRLANAGTDHRKFMRMMPVYVRITAPLYWWKEFDTSADYCSIALLSFFLASAFCSQSLPST